MIAAGAPGVLTGSPAAMAEQLEERRAAFGLSYVIVDGDSMEAFTPVVAGWRAADSTPGILAPRGIC